MSEMAWLQNYLLIGAVLFALGLTGFLLRRNLIVMFLCAELMLQGVSLSLVAWGRFHNDWGGQMLVIFIIAVAACEAGIALALVLMLCRHAGDLDVFSWQTIRETGSRSYVDQGVPELVEPEPLWPTLPTAGVLPEQSPDEELFRTRV